MSGIPPFFDRYNDKTGLQNRVRGRKSDWKSKNRGGDIDTVYEWSK